ncbi:Hpt domain-containing protein [Vibrio sp. TRT 1302]|uniref:Hpt domain-containing protein n=1 Tax=Vibrio sp. TRT 1302 TaxID=3418504 RepID=UPI003CF0E22C
MEGKALKIGWLLLCVWVACIAVLANSYRSTNATKEQIYELGSSIQDLRETFSFDTPYRVHMADSQSLDLQLIYALRLQIDAHYQESWYLPDVNQLLFTTDRFIEQTQIYLDNNLDLLTLVEQVRLKRERYSNDPELSLLYYRISANVLEAIFSDRKSSPKIYRELDQIYSLSAQLPKDARQDLQQVLAQISLVLGGYAQGQYIVDKLMTHDVYAQIDTQRVAYNQLLMKHIWLGLLLTLIFMLAVLLMIPLAYRHTLQAEPQQEEESEQEIEASTVIEAVPDDTPVRKNTFNKASDEPEINFAKMLESLNNDMESVCMLLEVFIEDHHKDGEQITLLLTDSPEEAQRKAHSLKGVGGNLGATKLRQAAGKVEVAIKDDITLVPDLLDELTWRLERAISEARLFLKEHNNQ